MNTTPDIEIPEDTRKSRLPRPARLETTDDYATAEARIAAFWEKYPDGSILPEVETRTVVDSAGVAYEVHTARAYIRKDGDSDRADVVAHATRGENDEDEVVRKFPQESAETSAISRAIRNLGIVVESAKPAETTPPREPQTDTQIGLDVLTAREAAGMSQADLAAAMLERNFRWSQTTVWNIEKGKRPLRFNEGQHLADLIRFGM